MENSKYIRTQFYSRFLWHVISILNVFQAWIARLTSASATRAWLSAPTVASASTDWETHSHARVQKASPLNFPLLSLRRSPFLINCKKELTKITELKPFQFVKVCSPTEQLTKMRRTNWVLFKYLCSFQTETISFLIKLLSTRCPKESLISILFLPLFFFCRVEWQNLWRQCGWVRPL